MSSVRRRRVRVGACLSLSGRFARFGVQAARALDVWASMDGAADLVVDDDRSDPNVLRAALPRVATRCDVLLGPYSTLLSRAAAEVAADAGTLLWNHGGAGDDVQASYPGHLISVLTPASRYAEPFLSMLADRPTRARLYVARGKGRFGRQVADGAEALARGLGIQTARIDPGEDLPAVAPPSAWDLFSVGVFEDDVQLVRRARELATPPRVLCAVAAGVREFGDAVESATDIFGVAQWFPGGFPGDQRAPDVGPRESDFLAAYSALTGTIPDYPAVQAVAAAALAAHCLRQSDSTAPEVLWSAAAQLDVRTLFGAFRMNPANGVQLGHDTVLVHWTRTR